MIGNVQIAFRPNLDQKIREKGLDQINSQDIFDESVYLKKLGPDQHFMEVFI